MRKAQVRLARLRLERALSARAPLAPFGLPLPSSGFADCARRTALSRGLWDDDGSLVAREDAALASFAQDEGFNAGSLSALPQNDWPALARRFRGRRSVFGLWRLASLDAAAFYRRLCEAFDRSML